jgi:hypothetical protein
VVVVVSFGQTLTQNWRPGLGWFGGQIDAAVDSAAAAVDSDVGAAEEKVLH